jgi:hypothetical protein
LTQVGFVQFLVEDDNNPNTSNRFTLDSVSIANSAIGAPTPEPAALAWIGSGVIVWSLRRKGR